MTGLCLLVAALTFAQGPYRGEYKIEKDIPYHQDAGDYARSVVPLISIILLNFRTSRR